MLLELVKEQTEKLQSSEETLKAANAKLRKLDHLKSDFISMVSHELRTPLTSIKNAAQIMLSGKTGPVNADQKRFLQMELRNIDRLTGIVNDVLSLSKLESGKVGFHFSELDLGPALHHVVSTFSPEAESLTSVAATSLPKCLAIKTESNRSCVVRELAPGTNSAREVHKKLAVAFRALSGSRRVPKLAPSIFGPATYPKDGTSGRELIESALASKLQRGRAYG